VGVADAQDPAARAGAHTRTRAAGPSADVVVLAGGTGGAKLARGMLDVVGPERLVVIANTGDDIEIYGARVSPDPDLISFWLADLIDERGWGLRGDTFHVMDALRELGVEVWFNLGDRDLAWCVERTRLIEQDGLSATAALARLNRTIGVAAAVLPMCEGRLRTSVNGKHIQEFLIRDRGTGPVRDVCFEVEPGGGGGSAGGGDAGGDDEIRPTPEVVAALAGAKAVIVGPSNPVISIWPILSALGSTLDDISVPVVCVSPIVGGRVLKGPTSAFLQAMQLPTSAAGVAAFYESIAPGFVSGVVADEPVPPGPPAWPAGERRSVDPQQSVPANLATLQINTTLSNAAARARVAEQVMDFAQSLR
jgi:LPPG:FO 2-phospho-L-lactate transferase